MTYDEEFIQEVTEATNKGLALPYSVERLLDIIKHQKSELEENKAIISHQKEEIKRLKNIIKEIAGD